MNSPFFLSNESISASAVNLWEQQVERLANVDRLSMDDYLELKTYLERYIEPDSYLSSATYFFFTGRNGLWSYSNAEQKVLFCWHPNCEGQILIFSPLDNSSASLLVELLKILPVPPAGIRIARVKGGASAQELLQHLNGIDARSVDCSLVQEEVLDWKYPVRVLSTTQVKNAVGNKFRNVRKGIIHSRKLGIRTEPLNLDVHRQDLRLLLDRWASQTASNKEEYADLYETYDSLFSLSLDKANAIDGLVYYIDGRLEAVSLWETPNNQTKTANLYANFCDIKLDGLAEFTIVSICTVLSIQGIELLNMGGSETSSLDFFKNKFRPAVNIELSSIEVKLGELIKSTNVTTLQSRVRYA